VSWLRLFGHWLLIAEVRESMWDLWWKKCQWGRFSCEYFSFSLPITIPPMFHIDLSSPFSTGAGTIGHLRLQYQGTYTSTHHHYSMV